MLPESPLFRCQPGGGLVSTVNLVSGYLCRSCQLTHHGAPVYRGRELHGLVREPGCVVGRRGGHVGGEHRQGDENGAKTLHDGDEEDEVTCTEWKFER